MKRILMIIVGLLSVLGLWAGNDYECYNIKRAGELIEEQQYKDASEYLDKEIEKNPTNGFAWFYYSRAYALSGLFNDALTAINKAIPLLKKDYTNQYMAYVTRVKAGIYYGMEDWESAADYYGQSLSLDKTVDDAYYWRGYCYYKLDKNSSCLSDMSKVVNMNGEHKFKAYTIMGQVYAKDKKYQQAISCFDNAIASADDDSKGQAYQWRSFSHWESGNKRQAIEDAIDACEAKGSGYLQLLRYSADNSVFPLIKAKLDAKIVKSDHPKYWTVFLGDCYVMKPNAIEAIRCYVKAGKEYGADDTLDNRIYSVLKEAACFDSIDPFYNRILEKSDDPIDKKIEYAYYVLDPQGKGADAIRLLNECIAADPEHYFAYYVRARIKRYQNRFREAIEDYSMVIMLNENYIHSYTERADCYKHLNETTKANNDYLTTIGFTSNSDQYQDCLVYSLINTSKKNEARKLQNKLQAKDGFNDYYDAACVWSLLNEPTKAITSLEKALQKGFRDFNHIKRDDDLNNIRNLPQFKSLISKYQTIHRQELAQIRSILSEYPSETNNRPNDERAAGKVDFDMISSGNQNPNSLTNSNKVSVPFTKEGGVTKVKCTVNGLPLSFIFDTGASKVTISSIEATFMYKNGYLSASDFGNSEYFSTASGEVTEGTVVTLRTVGIGGVKLSNVRATVVHNQNAPLLLGQSALSRLGKIEIDNVNNRLNIQPR